MRGVKINPPLLVAGVVTVWVLFWIVQTLLVFHGQVQLEGQLNERTEKLNLCAQLLATALLPGEQIDSKKIAEFRDDARRLAMLTRTAHGRMLADNLTAAIARLASSGPAQRPADLRLVKQIAIENNNYQRQRLLEDSLSFERNLKRVRILIALTTGGAAALSGMILGMMLVWLSRQASINSLVVKSTRNAVLVGDDHCRVVLTNRVFEQLLGTCAGQFSGLPLESVGPTGCLLARCIAGGEERKGKEIIWQSEGGKKQCFLVDVILHFNRRGRVRYGMAVLRDITAQWEARQKAEQEKAALQELAAHDALTGLFNYGAFVALLSGQTEAALKAGRPLSLLMLDLDHFKICNDTLGHPAGDELLRQFARMLERSVRAADLVARYGGDEFVVILPDTDGAAAYEIAERLRRKIAEYSYAGAASLPEKRLTASIGVATLSAGVDSADRLIKAADEALYAAKLGARNRVEIYHSALSEFAHAIPDEQRESLLVAVRSNLLLLQMRDSYTYYHSERVARLALAIGAEMSLEPGEQRYLRIASVLHDIGKVCVPPEILTKTSSLDAREWEEIKRHPQFGAEFLKAFAIACPVVEAVRHHHERWDGRGYPRGLKGAETPLFARIIGVSDAFDAMVVNRPYRQALSPPEAFEEIRRCAGTQFDPEIVRCFLRAMDQDVLASIYTLSVAG